MRLKFQSLVIILSFAILFDRSLQSDGRQLCSVLKSLSTSILQPRRQSHNGSSCHQPPLGHWWGFQEKVWEENQHSSSKWWDMPLVNLLWELIWRTC